MRTIKIPSALHEVLGERQSVKELLLLLAGTVAGVAALGFFAWPFLGTLPAWRGWLVGLLGADIVAGSLANFSRGTNDHYAARPMQRLVFIAIHVHLPLLALLAGQDPLGPLLVWAWTIGGALLVNARMGKADQVPLAGTLLAVGILLAVLVPGMEPWLRAISALFLLKVLYAFAVNHYAAPAEAQG
ncbi:MAG: hypothetical protein JNG85_13065 [Spirochaetaceae bacterium]|nr:hypothetical protein [Spirochaetaceae bacterium]